MEIRTVTVENANGIHMRVAAQIARVAREHKSTISLNCAHCPKANACSIMDLLMLGAAQGTTVTLSVEGPDESLALTRIAEVLTEGAGI